MSIAVVLSVTGQAWARDAEGNLRELRPGDVLQEGEVVVTSDDGSVDLDFGGGEAGLVVIEPGQEVLMQAELVPGVEVDAEQASVQDDEVEALLAALEDDDIDLLDILEDTAAGAGAGDAAGGGHGFVRLARITEGVDPLSFQYGFGLAGGPEGGLGEPQLLEEENFFPSAGSSEAELFDENLLVDGGSFFQGTLNFDFGLDGIGGINFAAMAGTTATIGTELVVYSWSGNTLTATIEGGDRDGIELFSLEVDPTTGEYTLTLLTNVLHTEPGTEGDESVQTTLTFTVLDSDGDSAQGSLVVTFFDDVPVIDSFEPALDKGEVLVSATIDESAGQQADELDVDDLPEAIQLLFAGFDGDALDDADFGDAQYARSGSAVVNATVDFGADGEAAGGGLAFSLALYDAGDSDAEEVTGGVDSGLMTTDGTKIYLYVEEGAIVGRVADGDGEPDPDGAVVFVVALDEDGHLNVVLYASLQHPDETDPNDAVDLDGLVYAVVTATDGDGDTTIAAAEVGAQVVFLDDGPTINFVNSLNIVNVANTFTGLWSFDAGADGLLADSNVIDSGINVLLTTELEGVELVREDLFGEDGEYLGEKLTAIFGDDDEVFFELMVWADGTYDFNLVTPNPTTTETLELNQQLPGNFTELWAEQILDGQELETDIRFTGSGSINPSQQGIGVGNNLFNAGNMLRLEFFNGDKDGNPNTSPDLDDDKKSIDSVTLTFRYQSAGSSTFRFTLYDEDGNILHVFEETVTSQNIDGGHFGSVEIDSSLIAGVDEFHSVQIDHLSGDATRFYGTETSISILPEDQTLAFTVEVVDGDGDSVTESFSVTIDADTEVIVGDGDSTVLEGSGDGKVYIDGTGGGEELIGGDDNDLLVAGDGGVTLDGGAGDDTLVGGDGNDTLIGGAGNDVLWGGLGADTFQWQLNDQGSEGDPAVDLVMDFTLDLVDGYTGTGEADRLDIGDLLDGATEGTIASYLHAEADGDDTVLHISTSGGFTDGNFDETAVDQTIILKGVEFSESLVDDMLQNGQLNIE
ncbi:retention module-containing protein [Halomonas salifodinae]|uniref:retention module-containing protein n=1 Tax=Halomonas salifodinae TaxID=438745 RepID=UPI00339E7DE9